MVISGRPFAAVYFYIWGIGWMSHAHAVVCATCGFSLRTPGVQLDAQVYCCQGCARGGPCYCSYDQPEPEDVMRAQSPSKHASATYADRTPITPEAFRWLETEVDRLAAMVEDESSTAWMKSMSGDSDAPTFMANGDFELMVRRLEKLRAAIASSQVQTPNGSAMVGTRVTVRSDDGVLESYVLVSPGASDARGSSISSESPVGAALMGRTPGETVHVAIPAGTLALEVVSVEEVTADFAQVAGV